MASIYHIRCSQCDLNQSIKAQALYDYLLPDGKNIPVPHEVAWCSDCDRGVHAERFPTGDLSAAEETALERRRKYVAALTGLMTGRQSPPKCLNCGSARVTYLDSPTGVTADSVKHPHCGGALRLEFFAMASVKQRLRLYTPEGDLLLDSSDV